MRSAGFVMFGVIRGEYSHAPPRGALCGVGAFAFVDFFVLRGGDFFIAIFLTTIIMLLINMVHSGSSIGVVKMIGIFIAMMIFIKLLGYMLICAAGPECITYHDRIGGSYADALEAGAGAGALAMVWKLMKMRRGI